MSSESGATSPAPSANAGTGDGKNAAANVSAAELIAHFSGKKQGEATSQTAETSATPQGEQPAQSPSAAEPVQPVSPEASTTTPEAPENTPEAKAEGTEGEGKEAEADDVLSPESSRLDQKTKERIQKRIDKEVGKRKALEAQLEQVRQQQQALAAQLQQGQPQPQPPASTTPAPIPEVKDPQGLKDFTKQVKDAARTVEALLDSEALDQNGKVEHNGQEYTKAQLKAHLREFRTTLEDKIPAQEEHFRQQHQFQAMRQQAIQQAHKEFPFLADRSSEDFKLAAHAYQSIPWLQQAPNGEYLAGLLVLGEKARQAALKASETPTKEQNAPKAEKTASASPPKPKPPGDQAAVSTTGSVARINPDKGPPAAPQKNISKDETIRLLSQRDQHRRK